MPRAALTLPEKSLGDWTPRMSVRHASLDEQHIILLKLGQDLLDVIQRDRYDREEVGFILQDIIGLSEKHDALEESILQAKHYPQLAEHRQVHAEARAQVARLLTGFQQGTLDTRELARVIQDWRQHHIAENDQPIRDYLTLTPGH